MKIAFDVDVLAKQMDINRMVHQVADWGYKYIEQSPHPRINPFYKHPLFSRECEAEYRKALRETGVEISSFIVVYRWSGPTEEQRKMAVANWKRMIEIAVDMGVPVINTELSGDPNRIKLSGFSKRSEVNGIDMPLVNLFLQKRWEDKDGNIYAKRIGTLVILSLIHI